MGGYKFVNKMRRLFIGLLCLLGVGVACAEEGLTGLFATYEGASVCYKLDDVPSISYTTIDDEQYAVLTFEHNSAVVRFALEEGKTLEIVFGTYQSQTTTDTDSRTHISTENSCKVIRGGKLIILQNGKQYDAMGRLVN